MRVLHVLPSLDETYGGPVRAVFDLSARARVFGLESEVIGVGSLQGKVPLLLCDSVHSVAVSWPSKYRYSSGLRPWLRSNVSRFGGVVLHGMWAYPTWAAAHECLAQNVPYACFPHGMLEPWALYGQGLWKKAKKLAYWRARERRVYEQARCLFFTTHREQNLAVGTLCLRNPQFIMVPYGVEVHASPVEQPDRLELVQPPTRKVGLFLGRVHPKKNVEFLVRAWARAKPGREWHLVIAGSGDPAYVRRISSLANELNLQDQVHLLGFVSGRDKTYLFQRADWFLLPSSQENFGIAVLEAVSNGCPVAISDQVFLAESFHQRSEVLPLNLEAWVRFLRERMVDASWREELRALDRTHLLPKFEIDGVSKRWADTLCEVFQSSRETA